MTQRPKRVRRACCNCMAWRTDNDCFGPCLRRAPLAGIDQWPQTYANSYCMEHVLDPTADPQPTEEG